MTFLGCIYVWKVRARHLLRQVGHPLGCRLTGAAVGFVCGARNSLELFRQFGHEDIMITDDD
jgi:hypothetical protein